MCVFYPVLLDIKLKCVHTLPTFASDRLMRAKVCNLCIGLYGVSFVSECNSLNCKYIVGPEVGVLLMRLLFVFLCLFVALKSG